MHENRFRVLLRFIMLRTPSGEDRTLVCVFGSAENSTGFASLRFSN